MRIKKWFAEKPIASKITFMYAGIFSVVFILISVFLLINTWYYYKNTSRAELEDAMDKIEEHIKSGGATDNETIAALNTNQYIKIIVTNENDFRKLKPYGDIRGNEEEISRAAPPPDFTPYMGNAEELNRIRRDAELGTIGGKPYMFAQRIVEYNKERYCIQVFRPYHYEEKIMQGFGIIFIIVNIIGIFIAYMIGKIISKKFLKPISDITETARSITINDLSRRIEVPAANDEIKNLVLTLNNMIEGLEISVEKQKQFISDASHELRTPISVIQGYANLIDRWGKTDSEILQEAIDSIKDETERMSSLINKLLFLAREESNRRDIIMTEVDLNAAVEETIREARVLDEKKDFCFEGNEDTLIMADMDMLKQLLWIFIENAIKYSDNEKGKIIARVKKDNDNAYIEIEDNGTGIKKEDIPYIFGRFYRGDKSRSQEIPGTGLGLSIAAMILKRLGESAEVKSEYGEGSTFILKFPMRSID